ncbi:MAG: hypothetical protein HYV07_04830 [Deltaproteobacteria bacterium]|nr:hypothetical protein [Deltaproteobacteria bacterium]
MGALARESAMHFVAELIANDGRNLGRASLRSLDIVPDESGGYGLEVAVRVPRDITKRPFLSEVADRHLVELVLEERFQRSAEFLRYLLTGETKVTLHRVEDFDDRGRGRDTPILDPELKSKSFRVGNRTDLIWQGGLTHRASQFLT